MALPIDRSAVLAAFARGCVAAGVFWAHSAALPAESELNADQPVSVTLEPGEQHTYRITLAPGRHHVALLERGIDVELSVRVGERRYAADSPTARFALEQVWFDLPQDADAIVVVTALRSKGVSAGDYRLDVRSNYEASQSRREAERLTELAMRVFNASYEDGWAPDERMSRRRSSLETYTSAAALWEEIDEPSSAAYCWHAAGFIAGLLLREQQRAQSYLGRATRNYRAAMLPEHALVAEKDIAQSLRREDRFRDASAGLAKIEALSSDTSDRLAFIGGVASNDRCLAHQELGEFDRARLHCERALDTFSRLGETIEFNNTLHNLAIVEMLTGNRDAAIARMYDLLERHEAMDEPVRYAQSLSLLVDGLFESGDIDAALRAYDQAVAIFEREGMQRWQATVLTRYSRIEQMLGRHEEARLHLEKALELAKAENSMRWQGLIKIVLADTDLQVGRTDDAIEALSDAVDIFRRSQSFDKLVSARIALAEALLRADRPGQAMAAIEGIERDRDLHATRLARVRLTRARILAAQNDLDQAIDIARQAQRAFEESGNLMGQLDAAGVEASCLAQQQRWDEALQLLDSQRERVRRIGHSLVLPELRARYFSQQQRFYETLITAYERTAETGDDAALRILNVVEEARATALRAHLEAPSSSWLENTPPGLRTNYTRARQRIGRLVQEGVGIDISGDDELVEALHEFERIQNQIWRNRTRFVELTDERPIEWSEIDRLLDDRTAILYVFTGVSERFAMLLEQGRRTRFPLVSPEPIDGLIRSVLDEFRSPNTLFGVRSPSAKTLSSVLLGPIAAQLDGVDKLVIVPDAGLHSVPVAALPHPRTARPLVETHETSNVASLRAALRYDTRAPARGPEYRVAAIGDPVTSADDPRLDEAATAGVPGLERLYGSNEELERLRAAPGLRDVSLHTGFDARKSLFLKDRLSGIDILHVAAHGISSETTAAKSGIFLSTIDKDGRAIDGHLGLADLFGVQLDIPLVVLSGCETSLGEPTWSEGPVGIARAFQYSGVPAVVSTLWKIDDNASAILVGAFYGYLAAGESVPGALRLAQLELMQDASYRHPYYWGAFQSLGDWSLRWATSQQQPAQNSRRTVGRSH